MLCLIGSSLVCEFSNLPLGRFEAGAAASTAEPADGKKENGCRTLRIITIFRSAHTQVAEQERGHSSSSPESLDLELILFERRREVELVLNSIYFQFSFRFLFHFRFPLRFSLSLSLIFLTLSLARSLSVRLPHLSHSRDDFTNCFASAALSSSIYLQLR